MVTRTSVGVSRGKIPPVTSLADRSRLGAEPLSFVSSRGTRIGAIALALFLTPSASWFGILLILHPNERLTSSHRGRLIEGHGVFTQMWGVFFILIALWAIYNLIPVFLNRVVFTRQGVHVVKAVGSTMLPWPPSRSALAVTSEQNKGYSAAVWLIRADGRAILLPGTKRSAGSARRKLAMENMRKAVVDADTIWAWAESRGLVQESGQYVTTLNQNVERLRLTPDEEEAIRVSV